jgi:hypothetical protein
MSSSTPLQGFELIDCSKANCKELVIVAAQRCGYGDDFVRFEQELKKAGAAIGVEINSFDDLVDTPPGASSKLGIEIAPETPNRL